MIGFMPLGELVGALVVLASAIESSALAVLDLF